MRDTKDEMVDKVLHGLGAAAPPDGMESRIVSALRHRASPIPAPSRLPWRTASPAAGAVLAGVVCVLFFPAQRKAPQAPFARSNGLSMRAASAPATPTKTAAEKPRKQAAPTVRLATVPPPKADLDAVSYPAPPMPLTSQEKLLLRLAHQGDPVQLAMLDPAQREAEYAGERAEVQRFFTPPKQEITNEP